MPLHRIPCGLLVLIVLDSANAWTSPLASGQDLWLHFKVFFCCAFAGNTFNCCFTCDRRRTARVTRVWRTRSTIASFGRMSS